MRVQTEFVNENEFLNGQMNTVLILKTLPVIQNIKQFYKIFSKQKN